MTGKMAGGNLTSQIQSLLPRLPPPRGRRGDELMVVVPSAATANMTRETEDRLMAHLRRRKDDMSSQQGRLDYGAAGWLSNNNTGAVRQQARSFMGKQYLCHQIFQGNYDWRPALMGGIYVDSNLHFPLTRRILLQQIARAIASFTGSDPWFTAYDVNISDTDLADKVERWMRFEGDQSKLTDVVNQAIRLAFIQGQQVVETLHESVFDFYKTYANVAVDAKGVPLAAKDGDYIYDSDLFIPYSQTDAGKLAMMQAQEAAAAGEPALPPPNDLVLKRDGATPKPSVMNFARKLIDKRIEHKQGAKSSCIHYLDFLAPLTVDDLDTADTIFRFYNEPVFSLVGKLLDMDWKGTGVAPAEQLERISEAVHRLIGVAGGDRLSGANQSRDELMEAQNSQGVDTFEPLGAFARAYTFFDIDGDGRSENLMIITDDQMQVPIYIDYLANVTWNGRRNLNSVRVNPVANRWHGQSQVEVFGQLQDMIDLGVNRANFSQMSSGWIDFVKWNKLDMPPGAKLELNGGTLNRVRDDAQMEDVYHRVQLYNTKYADIRDFIELLIQIAVNMSGVASANDSRMANLDTGELATGIKNIENSGDELFGVFIVDLKAGVEDIIKNFGQTSVLHMDKARAFKYFEGELGRLATITPEEVRDLKLDVNLALARARNMQDAQAGMAAWAVGKEFYTLLPPEVQQRLMPLARRLMKAYQQKDADEIIQAMQPAMIDPATGQPVAGAPVNGTESAAPLAASAPPLYALPPPAQPQNQPLAA